MRGLPLSVRPEWATLKMAKLSPGLTRLAGAFHCCLLIFGVVEVTARADAQVPKAARQSRSPQPPPRWVSLPLWLVAWIGGPN
jgi:hypothetical protein